MPRIERGHYGGEFEEVQSQTQAEARSVQTRNMNAGWQMKQAGTNEWVDAQVPGTNFTALLQAEKIEDPFYGENEDRLQWIEKEDWEYQMSFEITQKDLINDKIELVFDGLDTYADVYINEQLVLQADNMFLKWHVSCKNQLVVGSNHIRIFFHSPLKKAEPSFNKTGLIFPAENDKTENHLSVFTRKAPYHYGWDWGPKFVTCGVWRPVSLRFIKDLIIRNVQIHQESITPDKAAFTAAIAIESNISQSCTLEAKINGQKVGNLEIDLTEGINDSVLPFDILEPKLWWPAGMGKQHLYEIAFEVVGLKTTDFQSKRIGVRTFEVVNKSDEHGQSFYFKVNGRPFFAKGANYIPSDSFLDRVTPEKHEQIFKDSVDANMNMLRVWGGGIYENDIFYDLADEYGIVIWQDFMFACTMYPWDNDFLENIEKEAVSNIRRLRNHACLGLWCGNNEVQMGWDNWGWDKTFNYSDKDQKRMYKGYEKLFHELLPKLVKEYDAGRFYFPSSPISNWDSLEKFSYGDQHYWGVWHGEEPFENFKKFVPRFMSEFGFQAFPVLESVKKYVKSEDLSIESPAMNVHQKHPRGNQLIKEYMLRDYSEPKDFESFLYLSQVLQAQGMTVAFEAHRRNMPFCMGSLYWQLNDCWPVASWSSIDYYGKWKALHYAARHGFNNLLISFDQSETELQAYIVSDFMADIEGSLEVTVMDFTGEKQYEKHLNIKVEANTSQIYFKDQLETLLDGKGKTNRVLKATFRQGNEVLSSTLYYFDSPKNLRLERPEITFQMVEKDAQLQVTLNTNTLVKNLYISLDGLEGSFSDNFFDLLPGESKMVTIPVSETFDITAHEVKILTVNDASLSS
ncbi:beta-mannosidase [Reichenbachiella sp.]|uniref:beta-mannosidase n=1 Tax=Reichenbachiella sp. TaxID=2184521 RepID=UPI003BB0A20B